MIQLKFNLQIFGEKTENTTSKKSDAKKKGQVVFSKDFNMAITFMSAMLLINGFGGCNIPVGSKILSFSNYTNSVDDMFNATDISILLGRVLVDILIITAPIILGTMVVGVFLNYLQVGFLLTGETLKFKLDKLNPINGFKQIFSIRSLVELAKNLAKIMILSLVAYSYLRDKMGLVIAMLDMDIIQIGALLWELIYNLSIRTSLV